MTNVTNEQEIEIMKWMGERGFNDECIILTLTFIERGYCIGEAICKAITNMEEEEELCKTELDK